MYTRKDEAIRGVLIPVVVIGVPIGVFVLGQALGVNPNVTGLTFVAMLVGLVVWRIWVARHPERWPLPKKLFRALRAVGVRGARDQGGQGDDVSGLDDGFIVTCSDQPSVRAIVNEKTREPWSRARPRARAWDRT